MYLSIHYFRESEMARLTRVCPVGVPQHIIQRGNILLQNRTLRLTQVGWKITQRNMKRDRVCNPVTHVLKTIGVFKRFSLGMQIPTSIGNTFLSTIHVGIGKCGQTIKLFAHPTRLRYWRPTDYCLVLSIKPLIKIIGKDCQSIP